MLGVGESGGEGPLRWTDQGGEPRVHRRSRATAVATIDWDRAPIPRLQGEPLPEGL